MRIWVSSFTIIDPIVHKVELGHRQVPRACSTTSALSARPENISIYHLISPCTLSRDSSSSLQQPWCLRHLMINMSPHCPGSPRTPNRKLRRPCDTYGSGGSFRGSVTSFSANNCCRLRNWTLRGQPVHLLKTPCLCR